MMTDHEEAFLVRVSSRASISKRTFSSPTFVTLKLTSEVFSTRRIPSASGAKGTSAAWRCRTIKQPSRIRYVRMRRLHSATAFRCMKTTYQLLMRPPRFDACSGKTLHVLLVGFVWGSPHCSVYPRSPDWGKLSGT